MYMNMLNDRNGRLQVPDTSWHSSDRYDGARPCSSYTSGRISKG